MSINSGLLQEKKDFQNLILKHLNEDDEYRIRDAKTCYDAGFAMDVELLFEFLEKTQSETMQNLANIYGAELKQIVVTAINTHINRKGGSLLQTLKEGLYIDNNHIDLMYRQPASGMNETALELFNSNILSVMEEVYHKSDERIDLVIFLNGIAIMAIELKCNTSGQNYKDAIIQYKTERDPNTRLTKYKIGCLVFFAMDLDEVHMCTHLDGRSSYFLPFNMGCGVGINTGKGNPHNPDGINTAYMWEDILKKETVINLIDKIIFIEKTESIDPISGKKRIKEKLIFPRYHQLRALRRVSADIITNGTSRNYLIAHSAGSGKTNTIAWLAHRLVSLHDSSDRACIDKVIVATDRIVVDNQLQTAILGMEHRSGLIKVMDEKCTSEDLADAINGHCKVIVTTLHKFQYIKGATTKTKEKKFALIIDEAHSSTSGSMMESATYVMSEGDDAGSTLFDQIVSEINRSGKQANVTTIAFTATPKPTTLELFGTRQSDGKKHEFDLYSMKQAIEEGFILDVLENYITYSTYYNLNKTIEDDPELESKRAKRKIAKYVDLHETNISQKVEIIIEHFRHNVMSQLGGKAKAMIITSSREAAVRYYFAVTDYVNKKNYSDVKAVVAFTGSINIDNTDYTEESINGIKESALPEAFDGDTYQIMIVADKYQTGFDQPKLCAMYVDKKLKGVNAVQTLSRLNRICPPYDKHTFVLDFKNKAKDILDAFEVFYSGTILENSISPSDLDKIESEMNEYNILDVDDIDAFNEELYQDPSKRNKEHMWSLLDNSKKRFNRLTKDEKDDFIVYARRYVHFYCFLIQATCYCDVDRHKLYNYLSYLLKELDAGGSGIDFTIADKVSAQNFKQEQDGEITTGLTAKPEVRLAPPNSPNIDEDMKKKLSEIINEFNIRFNKNFDTGYASESLMQLFNLIISNPDLKESAKHNNIKDFTFAFEDATDDALAEGYTQNVDLYKLLLNNPDAKNTLIDMMKLEAYRKLRRDEKP